MGNEIVEQDLCYTYAKNGNDINNDIRIYVNKHIVQMVNMKTVINIKMILYKI